MWSTRFLRLGFGAAVLILGSVACQTAGKPDTQPGPIDVTVDTVESSVQQILENADRPLAARDIARELEARVVPITKALTKLRSAGVAFKVGEGSRSRWIGGASMLRETAEAFPKMIAYYKMLDPRTASLLTEDFRQFRSRIGRHLSA